MLLSIRKRRFRARGLNSLISASVLLLLSLALYYELNTRKDLGAIWLLFCRQLRIADIRWLLVTIVLLPFNWMAETTKWHVLLRRFETISFRRAFAAVLSGLGFAIFTPNRIGEFGGRLLYIRPEHRWKALVSTLVAGISQYLMLLSGGLLGAVLMLGYFHVLPVWQIWWVGSFGAVALLLFYLIYFNISVVLPVIKRLTRFIRRPAFQEGLAMLEQIGRPDLLRLLLWSMGRYALYSTQYYCLLRFLGIEPGIIQAYSGIFTIFLLQTIVPLPALAGLLLRGNLAVFVWTQFGANAVAALTSSFLLWIINLILPALIGTFLLFSVNISKSLGYEND